MFFLCLRDMVCPLVQDKFFLLLDISLVKATKVQGLYLSNFVEETVLGLYLQNIRQQDNFSQKILNTNLDSQTIR